MEYQKITQSNVHAATAAGISLNHFRKHLQERFRTDELTATWLISIFLDTLPQAIEDDPNLLTELSNLAADISYHLNIISNKANEAVNN